MRMDLGLKQRGERNSSIEVIKLIALILIIFSSAAPYGATLGEGITLL